MHSWVVAFYPNVSAADALLTLASNVLEGCVQVVTW